MADIQLVRWCLNTLTVVSALLLLGSAAALGWTNYRCRADPAYRMGFETRVGGVLYDIGVAPAGFVLRIERPLATPVQLTGAMDESQWQAWNLTVLDANPLHQFAGFRVLPQGLLTRTDVDRAAGTYTGFDVGRWHALFVPVWAVLVIPALLPLGRAARWSRRRRSRVAAVPDAAPPLRQAA